MEDEVKAACLEFESRYSIKEPNHVYLKCCLYNLLFIRSYPKFKGTMLQLLGHRRFLENRHPEYNGYENPAPDFYHAVALLKGDIVVDVTNKQLDSTGNSFRIMSVDQVKEEWLVLAKTIKEWEDYICMRRAFINATESIRLERYPSEVEKNRKKNININLKEGSRLYRKVMKHVMWHKLIFTGTEEDNTHLQFLNKVTDSI